MGSGKKTDDVKGRAKEAAGAILDDDELRKEGHVEQTAAKVKEKVSKAVDRAKEKLLGEEKEESRKKKR